jgi:Methyltransferase domain
LGLLAEQVKWIVGDIVQIQLEPSCYDVWHDRAVFHFFTSMEQRVAYVRNVSNAVKPGGYVIVSTFGPEGPTKCSGLEVMRYDAESLHGEFHEYRDSSVTADPSGNNYVRVASDLTAIRRCPTQSRLCWRHVAFRLDRQLFVKDEIFQERPRRK